MARTVNPEAYARQRARIVAAAAQAFAERGYDATSTAELCRRAGIGSGTLFHYFPTKAEILRAVFADDRPVLESLCARALAAPDPDAGLSLLVDHLVGEVGDPLAPGLAATASQQAAVDPELAGVLAANDQIVHDALATLLRRVRRREPDRLPLGPAATARWVRAIVDAGHLGLVDGPTRRTTSELRAIIAWLTGR